MPNYVKNIVIINGTKKQLQEVEKVCSNMNFHQLIPIPPKLNVPSGKITYAALGAYVGFIIGDDANKWDINDVSKYTKMIRLAQYEGLEKIIEYGKQYLLKYPIYGKVDNEHPYGIESEDLSYMWANIDDYNSKLPRNKADALALGHIFIENMSQG